jgi:hypothetical protein
MCTLVLILVSGCATSAGAGVAVKGQDIDVALMAGQWEGTYEGVESGRKGTISFDLATGFRLAEGRVMMNALGDPTRAEAKPLSIRFVEVGGGQVSGKIEPYAEPLCSCTVETEFVGKVEQDRLEGTFNTRPVGGKVMQTGKWEATRKGR